MEYKNLEELKTTFKDGKFSFPEEMVVDGIKYKYRSSSSYAMDEMIKKNYKAVVAYTTAKKYLNDARGKNLNQWIMFLWGLQRNSLVPYTVRTMNMARGQLIIKETEYDKNDNFIGSTVEVRITNMPGSSPLKGKVDTGADVCSLHATQWKVEGGNVHFKCPELSQNTIMSPLIDQQAVKSSDGGTEYRPVIELNIKINGKILNGIQFNLNDRGKMTFPVLIGKNALQAGKFKIDPSLDESDEIDWEYLQNLLKDDVVKGNLMTLDEAVIIIQDKMNNEWSSNGNS